MTLLPPHCPTCLFWMSQHVDGVCPTRCEQVWTEKPTETMSFPEMQCTGFAGTDHVHGWDSAVAKNWMARNFMVRTEDHT